MAIASARSKISCDILCFQQIKTVEICCRNPEFCFFMLLSLNNLGEELN